jgi:predicted acetyltransferase
MEHVKPLSLNHGLFSPKFRRLTFSQHPQEVQMYFFHRVEKGCRRRLLMTAAYTVLTDAWLQLPVAMAKENRQALSRVKKCQECQDVKKQE